jgi:hypothetical protein
MTSPLLAPQSPEKRSIRPDLAEHILREPDNIFTEYRKLLEVLSKKSRITQREVSIIYRREVGNVRDPEFALDQACVSWLVNNYQDSIGSPAELSTLVEGLSGITNAELSNESSAQVVEEITEDTTDQIQRQLPDLESRQATGNDNDISQWLVDETNRRN